MSKHMWYKLVKSFWIRTIVRDWQQHLQSKYQIYMHLPTSDIWLESCTNDVIELFLNRHLNYSMVLMKWVSKKNP